MKDTMYIRRYHLHKNKTWQNLYVLLKSGVMIQEQDKVMTEGIMGRRLDPWN